MKILVIEDNKELLDFLNISLKKEGFTVEVAEDGQDGMALLLANRYDLVILDLNLPSKSGYDICQELRKKRDTVPILVLTVNNEVDMKVELLNLGADDYLIKPFSFKELVARINALLRWPRKKKEDVIKVGNLELDNNKKIITKAGEEIHLTRTEFSLLGYLMQRGGEIVSKVEILNNVWDSEADLFSKTLETHILNIRKKLDQDSKKYIKTVPGRGYRVG